MSLISETLSARLPEALKDALRPARDLFKTRMATAQDRIDRLSRMMNQVQEGAQRVVHEVNREAERMGLGAPDQGPVIDIGKREPAGLRLARGAGMLVVAALLLGGLLSFTAFFAQFLLAIVIAHRVLKIRIDLFVPQANP